MVTTDDPSRTSLRTATIANTNRACAFFIAISEHQRGGIVAVLFEEWRL